jgi:hypothetical protein
LRCDRLSAAVIFSTIQSAREEFVCRCEHLRLPTIVADQQLDPAHIKLSTNTFVQYTRFFSYGLIATVVPSKG